MRGRICDSLLFPKVLHLIAVGETLEILDTTIPLKQGVEAQKSTYVWLQSVYACQRAVNSALHLPVNTPQSKELILKLRYDTNSTTCCHGLLKLCSLLLIHVYIFKNIIQLEMATSAGCAIIH